MTWVSLGLQVSHWTWASILWVLLPLFCMQVAVLSCCVAADKLRPLLQAAECVLWLLLWSNWIVLVRRGASARRSRVFPVLQLCLRADCCACRYAVNDAVIIVMFGGATCLCRLV